DHIGFVGRYRDLERLGMAWEAARSGRRQLACIAGEPGIGKTRLAAELAASVHAEGAIVLYGRCDGELSVPYQPIVEALSHYVAHCAPGALQAVLERQGGELGRLVPQLAWRFPDLPPPV